MVVLLQLPPSSTRLFHAPTLAPALALAPAVPPPLVLAFTLSLRACLPLFLSPPLYLLIPLSFLSRGITLVPITRALASITRLANSRHGYE